MTNEEKSFVIMLVHGHHLSIRLSDNTAILDLSQYLEHLLVQNSVNGSPVVVKINSTRFLSTSLVGYTITEPNDLMEEHLKTQVEIGKKIKKQFSEGEEWKTGYDEE